MRALAATAQTSVGLRAKRIWWLSAAESPGITSTVPGRSGAPPSPSPASAALTGLAGGGAQRITT